jgi:hypothetical protein
LEHWLDLTLHVGEGQGHAASPERDDAVVQQFRGQHGERLVENDGSINIMADSDKTLKRLIELGVIGKADAEAAKDFYG